MITNTSIDELYPKIQDNRTREYFDEVLSCFYSGNYRSAIVMLYSVAVCDLIFKLQRMVEIYGDRTSQDILDDIESLQTANPKSPDWENTLRDELFKKRRILTAAAVTHLENLQKDRHLCAHPVLKNSGELHRPNKLSVQAHIINTLEDILIVPAFLEKELLNQILTDLSSQKKILRRGDDIERYICTRYLEKLKSSEIECRLFINLWKLVFYLTDKDCSDNRIINFVFLNLLLKRNTNEILSSIKINSEKLSNWVNVIDLLCLELFVKLSNNNPDIYISLDEPLKIRLNAQLDKYSLLKNICFFLHTDLKAYFDSLLNIVGEDDDISYMESFFRKKFDEETALRLRIAIFSRSTSFYDAEQRYNAYISRSINRFTLENFKELLDAINGNGQIKCSYRVKKHFPTLKRAITNLDANFDFTSYPFI